MLFGRSSPRIGKLWCSGRMHDGTWLDSVRLLNRGIFWGELPQSWKTAVESSTHMAVGRKTAISRLH